MLERNYLIDLARVGSLLVVVIFHATLWQILLVDGRIQVVPWAAGATWWLLSWVFTIIPVFFVAAGYANAVVVDKWRASGAGYGAFLTLRGARLLGPMTLFIAFFALVGTGGAWLGEATQAAALSRQFAQLLWFAVVYQILLGLAPLLVAAQERLGAPVMVALTAAVAGVDVTARVSGDPGLVWVNLALAWPLAHQWGVAYHRGWFRTWRSRWLVALVLGCAAVISWLVFGVGYPPSAVAWADMRVANLQPPTLAIVALGLAQVAVLALWQRRGAGSNLPERVLPVLRLANALALTTYLWHIPAIVAVGAAMAGGSLLVPGLAPVLLNQWLIAALVVALIAAAAPLIARVEVALIPQVGSKPPGRGRAEAGYWLFTAGTFAVWQLGGLAHPGAPAATTALAAFVVGVLALRWAVGSTRS